MDVSRERVASGAKAAWPVVAACAGALASRYAVPFAFRYSMSFLPLVVAVLLFLLYRFQWERVTKASQASLRLTITCAITALLFSFFLVIGSWSICEDAGDLSWLHALAILVNAFPLYVLVVLLMGWLDERAVRAERRIQQRAFRLSWKGYAIVFAVLLLCWLPIFLAAFPGFFCYDMAGAPDCEWTQFETGRLQANFPIFHVLLLGHIITAGEALTGSFNGGVAIFVVIQLLIIGAIFTFMVRAIANASASKGLTVASIIYLALDPLVSMYAMCTTRDTLFSAFAVLFAVLLFTFFRNQPRPHPRKGTNPVPFPTVQPDATSQVDSVEKGTDLAPFLGDGSHDAACELNAQPKATSLVALGLAAIMVCFLRPNGIIAVVVLIPFLILFVKGARARLAMGGMCAAVLAVCWLWFGPIAGALNVEPSTMTRSLLISLPAQQITNVVDSDVLRLSEQQMLIDSNFGKEDEDGNTVSQRHSPHLADLARLNFLRMSTEDILRIYVTLGLAHPKEYFEAFVSQTQAAWNPYAYARVYNAGLYEDRETTLFACYWEDPAKGQTLAPDILKVLQAISGKLTLQNVPLLSLLVSVPFYLWLLILLLARTIITLDRRIAAPCILLVMLTLTAFFGPAVLVRYYLPIIFGFPLMLTLLACSRRA